MDEETLKDFEELFDFDISKKQLILNKIITDDKNGPNHIDFIDFNSMKEYIINELKDYCDIIFSGNKEKI